MNFKSEWKKLAVIAVVFGGCYFLPIESARFGNAVGESLALVKDYAREHVVFCLVPAFFIAGAVGVFISKGSVVRYLGAGANKFVAYSVASVSGTILAVCSCTVLPLFAGIYRMGAGLGPATAFLYSGPAINVLAIVLTARLLGLELGIARAVGAILFSVVIGLLMQLIFGRGEKPETTEMVLPEGEKNERPLYQTAVYFGLMVGILVIANWAKPKDGAEATGVWQAIYSVKWVVTGLLSVGLGVVLVKWYKVSVKWMVIIGAVVAAAAIVFYGKPVVVFGVGIVGLSLIMGRDKGEGGKWLESSWGFAKQILPLLFFGVLVAGFLLGRPGHEGIIPSRWVEAAVGGNSIRANVFAAAAGAFMYFATLTEVVILQGLMGAGMGKGPALALLLAGPALSLPNMLVIRSVMGTQKTVVYVGLVIVMASVSGIVYGMLF